MGLFTQEIQLKRNKSTKIDGLIYKLDALRYVTSINSCENIFKKYSLYIFPVFKKVDKGVFYLIKNINYKNGEYSFTYSSKISETQALELKNQRLNSVIEMYKKDGENPVIKDLYILMNNINYMNLEYYQHKSIEMPQMQVVNDAKSRLSILSMADVLDKYELKNLDTEFTIILKEYKEKYLMSDEDKTKIRDITNSIEFLITYIKNDLNSIKKINTQSKLSLIF